MTRKRKRSGSSDSSSSRSSSSSGSSSSSRSSSSSSDSHSKSKKRSREAKVQSIQAIHQSATGRTGGVYMPPFKMRMLEKSVSDKSSPEYQRITWDALKKSLNGLVNKVSQKNIVKIIPEIFSENLTRGKGPLCQSLMKSQAAAPNFSNIYGAVVAVVNTKLPEIGELLLKRLLAQWKKCYQRNQKILLISTSTFIAHLVNQYVCGVVIPLQILALLLDKPTDDSVEVAVGFVSECGQRLSTLCPKPFHDIFGVFRSVLHEGRIDKRVQYMIEHLFIVRKSNFAEHPAMLEVLDLVETNDQITHDTLNLDDEYDEEELQESSNLFHVDPNYLENEKEYDLLRQEILGEESSSDSNSDSEQEANEAEEAKQQLVEDLTGSDLLNFKKTVYLTIMSSLDFEECAHKLLKNGIPENFEVELCRMVIDACAQERSYRRFYGLLGQRFCNLSQNYRSYFMETCFPEQYENCAMLETNRLRHVAQFFSHLLHTDAIAWSVMDHFRLNEDDTNSSKRIFIKVLFKDLAEYLGLTKLNERLQDESMAPYFRNLMPLDNPDNTRFSVNFFTSIGLGGITVAMREHLKKLAARPKKILSSSSDSSDSDSSSDSSSD